MVGSTATSFVHFFMLFTVLKAASSRCVVTILVFTVSSRLARDDRLGAPVRFSATCVLTSLASMLPILLPMSFMLLVLFDRSTTPLILLGCSVLGLGLLDLSARLLILLGGSAVPFILLDLSPVLLAFIGGSAMLLFLLDFSTTLLALTGCSTTAAVLVDVSMTLLILLGGSTMLTVLLPGSRLRNLESAFFDALDFTDAEDFVGVKLVLDGHGEGR